MYKKHKIVMLPGDTPSLISKGKAIESLFYCPNNERYCDDGEQYQHLYVITNDDINKGDWYLHKQSGILRISNSNAIPMDAKKIIASTDKSLVEGVEWINQFSVPSIPEYFIKHFIEQYNSGNAIQEVEVLYDEFNDVEIFSGFTDEIIINTNISNKNYFQFEAALQIEKVYSRTEVIQLLHKFGESPNRAYDFSMEDWIEQNLK